MSAHSERPQSGQGENSSGGGVPGGDENFESGLDYGAFAEDEPDYPQDHLYPEDLPGPESDLASAPAGAPAGGHPEQPPAETLAEHRESAAQADAEALAAKTGENETAVLGESATLSDPAGLSDPEAPSAPDSADQDAADQDRTAAMPRMTAEDTSATQAIATPSPRPAVADDTNATRPINATLSDGERTTTLPAAGADSAEADSPRADTTSADTTNVDSAGTETTTVMPTASRDSRDSDATAAIPAAAAASTAPTAGAATTGTATPEAAAEQPRPASPAEPGEPARGTEPRVGRHGRADVEGRETDKTAYTLASGEAITAADLAAEVSRSTRGVSRFFQVLIAIFLPVIVIAAAIRLVASPAFLWLAYNRPGFPADTGDFGTGDRLLYGSYGVDYLFNAANSRYLSELAPGGEALFTADEVTHMTDVTWVIFWTMIAAAALLVLAVIFALLLRSWRPGGVARGIFAGAWVTLGLIVTVAVLAFLNFGAFFTEFHRLLFDDGTWTFSADSTLIRLYPEQFWIDAGIAVAAVVLIISVLALIMTWPTKRRRARRAARFEEVKARRREKLIAELNKDAGYSPATH